MDYGILGAGAQAEEVQEWHGARALFHVVDQRYGDPGRRRYSFDAVPARFTGMPVVAAVGAPALRRRFVEAWSSLDFLTVVASTAHLSSTANVGTGSVVAPMSVVSTAACVGSHCLVNIGATVSHDSLVDDFATISPGVHIAGGCTVGRGAFLGIGSVLLQGVSVGEGAVIGAGAVLTRNADAFGVYVGVPARKTRMLDGWLDQL